MHDLPDHQVDYWADRVNPGVTSSVTAARDSWMTSDLVAAKACFRNHFANSVRRNFSISCIAFEFCRQNELAQTVYLRPAVLPHSPRGTNSRIQLVNVQPFVVSRPTFASRSRIRELNLMKVLPLVVIRPTAYDRLTPRVRVFCFLSWMPRRRGRKETLDIEL